jgi:hypothetical protein
MSASKKKLKARVLGAVLGGALLAAGGGGCGATTASQGHSPGDATVVAASGR